MSQQELPHLPLPGERPSTVWRPDTTAQPRRRRISPFLLLLILILIGWIGWRLTADAVTINVNGLSEEIHTHRDTVAGVLRVARIDSTGAISVDPVPDTLIESGMVITVVETRPVIVHAGEESFIIQDPRVDLRVVIGGLIPLEGGEAIAVRRFLPSSLDTGALPREVEIVPPTHIVVLEDDRRVSFDTTARTLGEALIAAGYDLYAGDEVTPPLWTPLEGGELEVSFERALPVTLAAGGRTHPVRTQSATVDDFLTENGLALSDEDYVVPGPETPIEPGMSIRFVAVEEKSVLEAETIPFETVYVPDPESEIDTLEVIQPGADGEIVRRYDVRMEDGLEVSRVFAGEWGEKEPVPEIISYGTKIVIRTVETPDGNFQYWRTLRVLATSYCPTTAGHKKPGDPGFGIAAAGAEVVRGIVAVDPRVINLYQWMYIPGYGVGRALDTGGAIKGQRVDLGYSDAEYFERYEWIDIYLITPVPPFAEINWILPG